MPAFNAKLLETPQGLTIRQLKDWLSNIPDTDEYGEPREVWIQTGFCASSQVKRLVPLNWNPSSCDIVLESDAFPRP